MCLGKNKTSSFKTESKLFSLFQMPQSSRLHKPVLTTETPELLHYLMAPNSLRVKLCHYNTIC